MLLSRHLLTPEVFCFIFLLSSSLPPFLKEWLSLELLNLDLWLGARICHHVLLNTFLWGHADAAWCLIIPRLSFFSVSLPLLIRSADEGGLLSLYHHEQPVLARSSDCWVSINKIVKSKQLIFSCCTCQVYLFCRFMSLCHPLFYVMSCVYLANCVLRVDNMYYMHVCFLFKCQSICICSLCSVSISACVLMSSWFVLSQVFFVDFAFSFITGFPLSLLPQFLFHASFVYWDLLYVIEVTWFFYHWNK